MNNQNKNKVKALIDVVTMKPLVHVSGMFSPWQGCVSWVSPLAWHPSNQNAVIALRPEARNRLNAGYITCYFIGGALGSLLHRPPGAQDRT